MKPVVGIFTAALAWGAFSLDPSPALGAWTRDGIPIAASDSVEDHPIIARDDAGGAFIAWLSNQEGYQGYYVTRIIESGDLAPGWSDEGLEISGPAYDGRIIPDGAGGALCCWVTSPPYPSLWGLGATRVTSAGSLATGWPPHGLVLAGPPAELDPRVGVESPRAYGTVNPWPTSDGSGGVLIAWTYIDRYSDYVHVTHYLANGAFGGGPFNSYGYWPQICSDGNSGGFVSCYGSVKLWHFLGSGTMDPRWPAAGNVLSSYPPSAEFGGLCSDGAGGVFAAWLEQRGSPAYQYVIQHVTDSSAFAPGWPAGGLVLSPYSCQAGGLRDGPGYFDQRFSSIVPDGLGGALVAWQDTRADAGDIYVQRVLAGGSVAPGWPENGRAACIAPGTQEYPVLVGDGAGGALIAWQDERSTSDFDIYAQHVLADGALVPGAGATGMPVCTAVGRQYQPQIVEDGAGGAIVTWVDYRRGNADVYATRLGFDGPVGTLASLVRADARPGEVHLEWGSSLRPGALAELSRRDDAHDWSMLATLEANGSGRFVYEDRAVSAGERYRYRLGINIEGRLQYAPEVEITVPRTLEFALGPVRPNPTRGDLAIEFSLPDAAAARIEIIDLQGRIWVRRDVESPGPGRHTLGLARRGQLPTGLYWIRLMRRDEARSAKVAIFP